MAFNTKSLGVWSPEREFKVTAERTVAYALATNDANPRHLNGEVAPPVFAVVPMLETKVLEESQAGIVPAEFAMRVLHGEQDIFLHRPITPGHTLRVRACPIGVSVKHSGTTLVAKIEARDDDGEIVNVQYLTGFFRGATDGMNVGEIAPDHRLPVGIAETDPLAVVTQHVDGDQTYRYSAASGDDMTIHLDDEVARSVGLPGIIAHGLCTMAFTSQVAIDQLCQGDPLQLKRIAVRLARPVLPGEDVTTRLWAAGESNGHSAFAYQTTNANGDVVVTDGLAEVTK